MRELSISRLKMFSVARLKESIGDGLIIMNNSDIEKGEPLAVLLPYEVYINLQKLLEVKKLF